MNQQLGGLCLLLAIALAGVVVTGVLLGTGVLNKAETQDKASSLVAEEHEVVFQFELPEGALHLGGDTWHKVINNTVAIYTIEKAESDGLVVQSSNALSECCDVAPYWPVGNYDLTFLPRPNAVFDTELREAIRQWSVVDPDLFSGVVIERPASQVTGLTIDGSNEIGFGRVLSSYASNILAVTVVFYDQQTGALVEFDQCYNTGQYPFGNARTQSNVYDTRTTGLHELGHLSTLDLFNAACAKSLMYYQIAKNEIRELDAVTAECAGGQPLTGSTLAAAANAPSPIIMMYRGLALVLLAFY